MPTSTETLLFGAATMALAALALTGFGLRQRRYPGFGFWVAGLWITTAGALVGAAFGRAGGHLAAEMLMMQWPLLALVGFRRFLPRQQMPGRESVDWAVLGGTLMLMFASQALGSPLAEWVPDVLMACVHLYAATLLFMAPGGSENTPAQGLGAVMAITAPKP